MGQPDLFQPHDYLTQPAGRWKGARQVRYKIKHATKYFYGDSVPQCHNVLHLTPRRTKCQLVLSHALTVTPNPMVRFERLDFYGNPVTSFSLQEPHETLTIIARSEVD